MSSQSERIGALRRNGKPQSCEPCRKSKVACDHTRPCGRCKRRGISSQCMFHSAPMTRQFTKGPSGGAIRENGRSESSHEHTPLPLERYENSARVSSLPPFGPSGPHLLHPTSQPVTPTVRNMSVVETTMPGISTSGFMGSTSFSAFLAQGQGSLGIEIVENDQPAKRLASVSQLLLSEEICGRSQLGVYVLNGIPDRSICDTLTERAPHLMSSLILPEPLVQDCYSSMWSTYGKTLSGTRKPNMLLTMAEELNKNGESPLEHTALDTIGTWAERFQGHNLRWEVIGLIFARLGMAMMSLPDMDPLLATKGTQHTRRQQFASQMNQFSKACLVLCDDVDYVNDLLVTVTYHSIILESVCTGDSTYLLWRRLGSYTNDVTALGLHGDSDNDPTSPFFLREIRKRGFAAASGGELGIATFLGRPPSLSRHYCAFQLPLDISDEELMLDGDDLALVLSKLDSNGWNTDSKIHTATFVRAEIFLMRIREEILEVSLGTFTESLELRIEDLRRRNKQAYEDLPTHIRTISNNAFALSGAAKDHVITTQIYLFVLQSSFLLERLAKDRAQDPGQGLMDTARDMLNIVLHLWTNRERHVHFSSDLNWNISAYGIPAAGTLGIELLRQSQQRLENPVTLPFSELIQTLSIFKSCLEWVQPVEGNFELCNHMQKIIGQILDRVLSPPLPIVERRLSEHQPDLDFSNTIPPEEGTDFLEWLDAVDWQKGPWMDLERS